jgi:superfamily II DNA or RNA helicase
MLRINKPTLILAPTIAIRNQWIQRFCEMFLQTDKSPGWISTDIRNPLFLTVTTYQGLHAACGGLGMLEDEMEPEEEEIQSSDNGKISNHKAEKVIEALKAQNIKTIIVDEAHHLKSEWWHTLTKVKENIDPTIVGLTATPPYDVSYSEWQRYIGLNGPVDTEISVPELIIEGDLCPHQDYIFFSSPTDLENQKIIEFRNNIEILYQEITNDETLLNAFESFPAWIIPSEHFEWIYSNVSYYSAILIFLNANEKEISKLHLNIIGDKNPEIPGLDYTWMETVLEFYFYSGEEHFNQFETHRNELENKLRRGGAIEKKQIRFTSNKKVTSFLTSSISKLSSIKKIVDFEYQQLGNDLRLVILTDFIRKEFFIDGPENNTELNKIGVISIFEKLRRSNQLNMKIGVLTGAIVIIPVSCILRYLRKKLSGAAQLV